MRAFDFPRAGFWRALGFASVSLLAACSAGNVAPAVTTISVPTAAAASTLVAHAPTCRSNADCRADRGIGLCMPKPATQELSDAEDFLEQAMSLDKLVTGLGEGSRSSRMQTILQQVRDDDAEYGRLKSGGLAPGANAPPTNEEMQHAAWLQSGSTQAEQLVAQLAHGLSTRPVTTDAQKLDADITADGTGRHLERVVADLQTFLHDIDVVIAPSKNLVAVDVAEGSEPDLTTAAGALRRYVEPVLENLDGAMSHVRVSMDPSTLDEVEHDLTVLSQGLDGKDGKVGTCLESL